MERLNEKHMNTDIFTFTEALHKRVVEFTKKEPGVELVSTGKVLSFIRETMKELKAFTIKYSFEGSEDEVRFFKETKPVLLSQYFYYKHLFSIQLVDSFRDQNSRIDNYRIVLDRLQRFIQKNITFYKYCLSGETHLDKTYFLRGGNNSVKLEEDESFTTGYDTKLSKILASEMIKSYLIDSMKPSRGPSSPSSLNWTAPKTDLIELIYALNETGVFNHATADVRLIVETFETLFNVSLGNYYRIFLGIRNRKTGRTVFLDQLRERMIQRMEQIEDRV